MSRGNNDRDDLLNQYKMKIQELSELCERLKNENKKINKEMNISVLINIHHVDLALEYVDRIIGIKAGKIVYDGKASEIDNEILKEIYGGDLDKVGSSEDLLKRE